MPRAAGRAEATPCLAPIVTKTTPGVLPFPLKCDEEGQ